MQYLVPAGSRELRYVYFEEQPVVRKVDGQGFPPVNNAINDPLPVLVCYNLASMQDISQRL